MNEIGFDNLQKKCRICFTDTEIEMSAAIELNDQIADRTYAELFLQVTGYEIRDYEPQKICQKCGEVLIQVKRLTEKANETQVLLEKMLRARSESSMSDEIKVEVDSVSRLSDCEDSRETLIDTNITEKRVQTRLMSNLHSKSSKMNTYEKHHDEQINQCHFCKRCFKSVDRLQRHLSNCKSRPKRTDHEIANDKSLHVCPVCGNLSTSDHIRHHTKTTQHKDENSQKCFICDICGITTSTRSNIDMHMKVQHLNFRSFCRHCPGSFKNPSALARHKRKSHSEILQDYKCRTCNFRTSVEKEARNHRESHRLKKLVCHECGQEFHKAINLRYHMASHSDQRPYACETCGSAFKTTKALGAHKKTHKAYDYECPVCTRSYLTNQLMRNHVEKNHPEFDLPPPGTVFSKSYRKKMAERKLKEIAIKQGVDVSKVNSVVVPETVIYQVQSVHVVR